MQKENVPDIFQHFVETNGGKGAKALINQDGKLFVCPKESFRSLGDVHYENVNTWSDFLVKKSKIVNSGHVTQRILNANKTNLEIFN